MYAVVPLFKRCLLQKSIIFGWMLTKRHHSDYHTETTFFGSICDLFKETSQFLARFLIKRHVSCDRTTTFFASIRGFFKGQANFWPIFESRDMSLVPLRYVVFCLDWDEGDSKDGIIEALFRYCKSLTKFLDNWDEGDSKDDNWSVVSIMQKFDQIPW